MLIVFHSGIPSKPLTKKIASFSGGGPLREWKQIFVRIYTDFEVGAGWGLISGAPVGKIVLPKAVFRMTAAPV